MTLVPKDTTVIEIRSSWAIDETPPKLYLRVGRFDREYAGDVQSLRVRDGNELLQLREFVPKVPETSAGRIK